MTREEIHNEIGNILKLIEINNNRMFLNDADFELDLELMKSYIVQLYKLQEQLRISQPDVTEEVTPEPPKKVEPVVIKATPKPRSKPPVAKEPEPVVAPEPEPAPKPEPIVEPEPEPQPIVEETPVEQTPVAETPEPEETPGDQKPEPTEVPKTKAKSGSKKPAPAAANDVYARLKNTKIDSIKKGISISKRYEMQNELFANNPEAYNEAIKTLDNQNSFDDAMSILEGSLMTQHGWEEEDFLVDELRILLYRRYA